MKVIPATSRHTLVDSGQSLTFSIPSQKQWATLLFTCFWCVGWAFGEVTVLSSFFSGKAGAVNLFLIGWLGAWTVGGATVIYSVLWQLAGKEVVVVDQASITITPQIFGFGFPKIYATEHIKNLRDLEQTTNQQSQRWIFDGSAGLIAFDYGAKTVRFARGIDEAEAKQITKLIHARFPKTI